MSPRRSKASAFNADYLTDIGTAGNDIFGKMEQETKVLQEEVQQGSRITLIPIEKLRDNPHQGREAMDEEELQALTDEIRESGFLGVLVARISPKDENYYEILSGHRRKLAAERAGLVELPVIVRELTDEQMLFLGAKENILRVDFTPLEEGKIFQRMIEMNYTQVEVAARVHKSRGYIRARLVLTNTYSDIQEMVTEHPETVRAAYYLSQIHDELVRREAEKALISRQISGDAVPTYVQKLQEARKQTPSNPSHEKKQEGIHSPQPLAQDSPRAEDANITNNTQHSLPLPLPTATQPAPVSASAKDESRLEKELTYLQGYANRLKQRTRSTEEKRILEDIMRIIQQINEVDPSPISTP